MFLDAQQRQFNSSGFPYISPVLHDDEGKIAQGAESIVIEESHEVYAWVLTEMARLEPRFRLDKIRIIFADMGITNTLLHKLSIHDTCLLRCDYWHLMNKVWNKHTSFGSHFDSIKHFLKAMLESRTKEEFDSAFLNARRIVCFLPTLVEKLEKIHGSPEYYSGYYLREMEGGLGRNGSAPAKENHSSVVAYIGEGGLWCIAEQIKYLLDCQKDQVKRKLTEEHNHHISIGAHCTKDNGFVGMGAITTSPLSLE